MPPGGNELTSFFNILAPQLDLRLTQDTMNKAYLWEPKPGWPLDIMDGTQRAFGLDTLR